MCKNFKFTSLFCFASTRILTAPHEIFSRLKWIFQFIPNLYEAAGRGKVLDASSRGTQLPLRFSVVSGSKSTPPERANSKSMKYLSAGKIHNLSRRAHTIDWKCLKCRLRLNGKVKDKTELTWLVQERTSLCSSR